MQGLWEHQTNAIIDAKLVDANADTHKYDPMDKLLARWENQKKYNHGKHFHEQRNIFYPCVISVDGIL